MAIVRLSAIAIAFAAAAFAQAAYAGEPGSAQSIATRAAGENIVLALALKPPALAVESNVIEVQKGKKFKKGKGFKAGPGGPAVGVRRGSRRGRIGTAVGIGLGAVFLGSIIASEAARANAQRTCERWAIQCDNGSLRACRRFDDNCM